MSSYGKSNSFGAMWQSITTSAAVIRARLADLAPHLTPYRYAFNNPIRYHDPSGLIEVARDGGGVNPDPPGCFVFCIGLRAGLGTTGKFSGHLNLSAGYQSMSSVFNRLVYASISIYSGNNLGNSYTSFANADFTAGIYGSVGSGSAGAHPIYGLNYDNPLPISNTFKRSFGMGIAGTYNYGINSISDAPGAQINTNFNIRTGGVFSLNTSNDGYLNLLADLIGIKGIKNVDAGHTGALSIHAGSRGQFSAGYQQFTGAISGNRIQHGYGTNYEQFESQMNYNRANTFIGLNGFRAEYSGEPYLQNRLHKWFDNKTFITPTHNRKIFNTSYGN